MTDIREKLGEIRAALVDQEYVDVPMLLDALEIALEAFAEIRIQNEGFPEDFCERVPRIASEAFACMKERLCK